jgi:cobalamin biosynthesis protein CobD/CbiB
LPLDGVCERFSQYGHDTKAKKIVSSIVNRDTANMGHKNIKFLRRSLRDVT